MLAVYATHVAEFCFGICEPCLLVGLSAADGKVERSTSVGSAPHFDEADYSVVRR